MKEHVYELVRSNDPKKRLYVVDIDEAEQFEDVEVVYGVGASQKLGLRGYTGVGALELFEDVLRAGSEFDPKAIVTDVLTRLKRSKYIPAFRYLRAIGALDREGGLVDEGNHDQRVRELAARAHEDFYPPKDYRKNKEFIQTLGSVAKVLENYSSFDAVMVMALLRSDQIDLHDLRSYLLANMSILSRDQQPQKTYFGALIGLYDCLAYKRDAPGR